MTYELYHGDCLDVMPTIPDNSIDMILVDPPFGTTQNKWDTVIDLPAMWKECKRIIKPNRAIVFFAMQPFTSVLVCSNLPMFKYDWAWRKPKGTGHLNAKKMPMRDKEDILIFSQGTPLYHPQMSKGESYKAKAGKQSTTESYGHYGDFRNDNQGTRYPKQILEFGVVEGATLHPTQKPLPLLRYLIRTYSNEGDTILDFCFGSCSTGVACLEERRNFIGIEKDTERGYFEIATNRMREAVNAPRTLAMELG